MKKKVTKKKVIKKVSEEKKGILLDLACGINKREGFIGIDLYGDVADIKHDLNIYPWPFEDDSVDEIFCSHYVEHVEDLMKFFNECYRIMKVDAKMQIISPYYSSVRAMQDPTHKNFISEMSFLYYNKKWLEDNKLDHYPISCNFNYVYGYAFHPNWATRSEEARNFALIHYINVVTDIQVMMTKLPME